jgi:aromatic ring-opening dioxygenase catalytic subunit (LigB family)
LIYAATTVITERITEPGKKVKNRRNKDSWKIRIQRQISNWRKELSILIESGSGSDNIKLNTKKRKIFQKYKVTNTIEIAQLIEELKQKLQAKAQRMRRYEKRKNQYIQNKMFKEDTKQFYQYVGVRTTAINDHLHMEEVELY